VSPLPSQEFDHARVRLSVAILTSPSPCVASERGARHEATGWSECAADRRRLPPQSSRSVPTTGLARRVLSRVRDILAAQPRRFRQVQRTAREDRRQSAPEIAAIEAAERAPVLWPWIECPSGPAPEAVARTCYRTTPVHAVRTTAKFHIQDTSKSFPSKGRSR